MAKSANVVEYGFLEHCLREDLNETAQRVMAVLRPIKLTITNYPAGKTETVTVENNPLDPLPGPGSTLSPAACGSRPMTLWLSRSPSISA